MKKRAKLQCVIPARLGSKRIPQRNLLDVGGKPMLASSIEAALNSALFDVGYVATQAKEIAGEALKAGASVPFLLDKELCGNLVPSWHACRALEREPQWRLAFGDTYVQERPLLPKRYRPNGSVKIADRAALLQAGGFPGPGLQCFETPEDRSVHVGSDFEPRVARALLGSRA